MNDFRINKLVTFICLGAFICLLIAKLVGATVGSHAITWFDVCIPLIVHYVINMIIVVATK